MTKGYILGLFLFIGVRTGPKARTPVAPADAPTGRGAVVYQPKGGIGRAASQVQGALTIRSGPQCSTYCR
jgi:hypothetical protein